MSEPGIRVRLRVDAADQCPVASASASVDGSIDRIDWSPDASTDGTVVEEFSVADGGATEVAEPGDAELIFTSDRAARYRFERDPEKPCICQAVERLGAPVADVTAEEGNLLLTVYATDAEQIQDIVTTLDEEFGGIDVDSISRSSDGEDGDPVLFDRSRLTDRQREVLETALEMGYFKRPRDSNATEVAEELDIALSTFVEHLAAAQSKLVDGVLGEPGRP